MMDNNGIFTRSTTLISIGLAILGLVGVYITPANANFILIGSGIVIILVLITNKINQINENTESIRELHQKLNTESRIGFLEKELSELKGKMSMVVSKK